MRIGLDIGGTKIRIGLIDDSNCVVSQHTVPCESNLSKDDLLERIANIISDFFTDEVSLIGAGVPAIVDDNGVVYDCVNIPSWDRVELKAFLESRFKVPVQVRNDCNCFAIGAFASDYGKNIDDMVGITLGTGVGAGLIFGRKFYSGKNSGAGEIGSFPYRGGILEDFCSSRFFVEHGTNGKTAWKDALNGSERALEIWSEFGENIADLIGMTLLAYDPQVIVIGGSIASAAEFFSQSMYAKLKSFIYPRVADRVKIIFEPNGEFQLLGATYSFE